MHAETAEPDFVEAIFNSPAALLLVLDKNGTILRFNKGCERATGYRAEEIVGRHFTIFIPEGERERSLAAFERLLDHELLEVFELQWIARDGQRRIIEWSGSRGIAGPEGEPFVIGIGVDVTERRNAEQRLSESERHLREITAVLAEGVYVVDENHNLTFMNPAAEQLLGWRQEELIGKRAHDVFHDRRTDGTPMPIEECPVYKAVRQGKVFSHQEEHFIRKDGSVVPVAVTAAPIIRDGAVRGSVTAFHDVTDRLARIQELRNHAMHDPLTGLPNRLLLIERLADALASAKRYRRLLALLFVDLDGFKAVNDNSGHEAGDDVLKTVARRLKDTLRDTDIVARLAGDEFVVVLHEMAKREDAGRIADKLIAAINRPIPFGNTVHRVGASIGISHFPGEAEDSEALLRQADCAMYDAKAAGRNRWIEAGGPVQRPRVDHRVKPGDDEAGSGSV